MVDILYERDAEINGLRVDKVNLKRELEGAKRLNEGQGSKTAEFERQLNDLKYANQSKISDMERSHKLT